MAEEYVSRAFFMKCVAGLDLQSDSLRIALQGPVPAGLHLIKDGCCVVLFFPEVLF